MRLRTLLSAMFVCAVPWTMAGQPRYERIDFLPSPGRTVFLRALNDRNEVVGQDCNIPSPGQRAVCDLFLWTESGKRVLTTTDRPIMNVQLNNVGHIAMATMSGSAPIRM